MSEAVTVSTEVAVRVFETTPAVVSFNYQEISDHLDSVLANYKGLVFTESTVTECKKTIAELRKGQKSLDEFRKATKKQLTESVTNFEFQCKVLYDKFAGVIQPLTVQQDQFEVDRREKKRLEVQDIINALISAHGLNEKYSAGLIIQEEYFNKGKTIKAIKTELTALANSLKVQQDKETQDFDLIKTKVELANTQYQLRSILLPVHYHRLLGYLSVAEIEEKIISDALQISYREREEAEALLRKQAEAPKEVNQSEPELGQKGMANELALGYHGTPIDAPISPVFAAAPEAGKTITAVYEISGTEEQLSTLEAYLDANNFTWIDKPNE